MHGKPIAFTVPSQRSETVKAARQASEMSSFGNRVGRLLRDSETPKATLHQRDSRDPSELIFAQILG